MSRNKLCILIGSITLLSSIIYILSDLIELLGGGFSATQLYLTYAAFVLVPFFLIGLYALQLPRAGGLGLAGAAVYGISYIFFAGTAIYALAAKTSDYEALVNKLEFLYTLHGILMVIGGALFGVEIIRAKVLPLWTGITLIIGVIFSLVINFMGLPDIIQVISNTIRSIAFIGMAAVIIKGISVPDITKSNAG